MIEATGPREENPIFTIGRTFAQQAEELLEECSDTLGLVSRVSECLYSLTESPSLKDAVLALNELNAIVIPLGNLHQDLKPISLHFRELVISAIYKRIVKHKESPECFLKAVFSADKELRKELIKGPAPIKFLRAADKMSMDTVVNEETGETLLFALLKSENLEMYVKAIYEDRDFDLIQVNSKGETVLHVLANNQFPSKENLIGVFSEHVDLFLPDHEGRFAFEKVVNAKNQKQFLECLKKKGCFSAPLELDQKMFNALIFALSTYESPRAKSALSKLKQSSEDTNLVFDLNTVNYEGLSPLHLAVRADCYLNFTYMIKMGADPLARDRHGKLPIDYFSSCGSSLNIFLNNCNLDLLMDAITQQSTPDARSIIYSYLLENINKEGASEAFQKGFEGGIFPVTVFSSFEKELLYRQKVLSCAIQQPDKKEYAQVLQIMMETNTFPWEGVGSSKQDFLTLMLERGEEGFLSQFTPQQIKDFKVFATDPITPFTIFKDPSQYLRNLLKSEKVLQRLVDSNFPGAEEVKKVFQNRHGVQNGKKLLQIYDHLKTISDRTEDFRQVLATIDLEERDALQGLAIIRGDIDLLGAFLIYKSNQLLLKLDANKALALFALDKVHFEGKGRIGGTKQSKAAIYFTQAIKESIGIVAKTLQEVLEPDRVKGVCDELIKFADQLMAGIKLKFAFEGLNETGLNQYISHLKHRIDTLPKGEQLLIPVGCRNHATLLEIERRCKQTYHMRLFNTGLGLHHHYYNPKEKKYETCYGFSGFQNLFSEAFLRKLVSLSIGAENMDPVYSLLKIVSSEDKRNITGLIKEDLQTEQKSGSCTAQCQISTLRYRLIHSPVFYDTEEGFAVYKLIKGPILESYTRVVGEDPQESIQRTLTLKLQALGLEQQLVKTLSDLPLRRKEISRLIDMVEPLDSELSYQLIIAMHEPTLYLYKALRQTLRLLTHHIEIPIAEDEESIALQLVRARRERKAQSIQELRADLSSYLHKRNPAEFAELFFLWYQKTNFLSEAAFEWGVEHLQQTEGEGSGRVKLLLGAIHNLSIRKPHYRSLKARLMEALSRVA